MSRMDSNVIKTTRFQEKSLINEATRLQLKHLTAFWELAKAFPDLPLWPIVISIMEEFLKPEYQDYHPDYLVVVEQDADSISVVFKHRYAEPAEMFLSIQACSRGIPRAAAEAPSEIVTEFIEAVADINSDDTSAARKLIRMALEAISAPEYKVVHLDGSEEENLWTIQSYTRDHKFLMDVQVDYYVIHAAKADVKAAAE